MSYWDREHIKFFFNPTISRKTIRVFTKTKPQTSPLSKRKEWKHSYNTLRKWVGREEIFASLDGLSSEKESEIDSQVQKNSKKHHHKSLFETKDLNLLQMS